MHGFITHSDATPCDKCYYFIEVYPRVEKFNSLIAQQWNDQATVVFDSFERASGCRYFAIIDQDEFFIPGENRTLKEMFVSILFLRHSDPFKTFFIIISPSKSRPPNTRIAKYVLGKQTSQRKVCKYLTAETIRSLKNVSMCLILRKTGCPYGLCRL